MENLKAIARQFKIAGNILSIAPFGGGHINDTYRVATDGPHDYVLQRINHAIFQDVEMLQNNIERITTHIRAKLAARGESDIERKTLRNVRTADGKLYHFDGSNYWRVTVFIPGATSYDQVTPELARETGRAFGDFQGMLADLPGEPLGATIPDFHNMEFRLRQLHDAVAENRAGRVDEVRELIDQILSRADEMTEPQRKGILPKRISHCDTKVNNVMFDEATGKVLCVIDLDTTMPGYVMSDFGDFMRTAGNTGAEDDKDLTRVGLNMDIFKAFARGYLEGAGSWLTDVEIEYLPFGARLLTYMQTVRFLADYINGDTYYKIKYPDHNLVRSHAQFAHLLSLEKHDGEMKEFIRNVNR